MEDILENCSNSVSSIMSLDRSDTNQSEEKLDTRENKTAEADTEENKTAEAEKGMLRNFAQISEIRERSDVDSHMFETVDVNDNDDDLKELNSEVLSKQISKVVTQLEKQVLDEPEKGGSKVSDFGKRVVSPSTDTVLEDDGKDLQVNDFVPEQDKLSGLEGGEYSEMIATSQNEVKAFEDVQIKVIDVPDDDDLFDFLKRPPEPECMDQESNLSESLDKQDLEELKQRELYRLLTESNPPLSQSNEVTPYHSGDESEASDRSGTTEELHSESESDNNESLRQPVSYTEEVESRPETPCKEEPVETPLKGRRKPRSKQKVDKPPKKPKLTPGQLTEKTLEKLEKCRIATDKWLKDLQVPDELSLEKTLRFDIVDLNPYLTCGLCKGYLYEASTITECMHTFCKNCIVRHCMEVSLHCPVCNILIHPTDPFVHIRLDRMIQDIVYKILPNVAETEMNNIKAFYEEHPEDQPKVIKEEPSEVKISPKEKEIKSPRSQQQMVSLLLESENDTTVYESIESLEKKFVRVTSSASVRNVCDFIRKKLSLHEDKQVELFCCGDAIEDEALTLDQIKKTFFTDEDCLMLLQYRLRET